MRRLFSHSTLILGFVTLCLLAGCHKDPPAEPVRATTGEVRDVRENSVIVTGRYGYRRITAQLRNEGLER